MFRQFLDATDYWFGYSDNSSAGSYDPARECFVVLANDQANAANVADAGDGEVPPGPGTRLHQGAGTSAPPPSPPRGANINAQLAQARELETKLAEEYHAVRLLRASVAREASARGEGARELGKQARERINVDFDVDNPNTPPRASQGFYWPTAVADASEIVRTCKGCQFYARKSNLPTHVLQTIPVTWPFAVWGLDIVGPLRKAPGGFTHLLVAIDKFSKWVEVRPITNLRAEQAVTFFADIVYRFGVPNSIITDNGSQFTGRKFLEFCDKFHICVDWAALAHPQTKYQVEQANDMILQGLKPRIFNRLNKSGRKWLQELPAVVWSLRTTPSRATGFTPFFLVYGTEAILPTELEYGSPRVRGYDEGANQQAREDSLDQLDEARTMALMHSARYQQALRCYQARKIRRRDFSEGDLVVRLRQC
jgi:transposase InsO family protein